MIYVTVGTHRHAAFDRLLTAVDEIAPDLDHPVFAQIGPSAFVPKHMKWASFLDYADAENHIRRADLVIAHAGMGIILQCRRHGVRLIVAPRRRSMKEHFNDHQVETCGRLGNLPGVRVLHEMRDLRAGIDELLAAPAPDPVADNPGADAIGEAIREFLNMPPLPGGTQP